jgi:outer membrane biogenesis lipoprotein LolB
LSRIEQGGWTIDYSDWQAGAAGIELPSRLNARPAEASVRLVIDSWGGGESAGGGTP